MFDLKNAKYGSNERYFMFNEGMVPCFGVLVLVSWNGER
jgi:hypothetical protein